MTEHVRVYHDRAALPLSVKRCGMQVSVTIFSYQVINAPVHAHTHVTISIIRLVVLWLLY